MLFIQIIYEFPVKCYLQKKILANLFFAASGSTCTDLSKLQRQVAFHLPWKIFLILRKERRSFVTINQLKPILKKQKISFALTLVVERKAANAAVLKMTIRNHYRPDTVTVSRFESEILSLTLLSFVTVVKRQASLFTIDNEIYNIHNT